MAAQVSARGELQPSSAPARLRLRTAQRIVAAQLLLRQVRVSGTAEVLVNAIFVQATPQQAQSLLGLPGVKRVEYLPPLKRHLDRAADLVRAPAAWNALGGTANAGAGMRIGIIDSGIDHTHAAFQDSALPVPPGFPKGRPEDLPYTNRKIIVARSYVSQLPFADVQAVDSRPDDLTPRDRVGHGTAVAMIAAGVRNTGPAATITGIAPKAYIGNYKIYGSPGVNDTTSTRVLIQAMEDALNDGMDVVTISSGSPAGYSPLARCKDSAGRDQACDLRADAVESATRAGMAVVVSAGNDGDAGIVFPSLNTIHSPGTAAAAITVGASTNAHIFFASVRVDELAGLRRINALFGDGPRPDAPFAAPLRDVQQLQDDGFACSPLGNGSLTGAIALVKRGNCGFSIKIANAQRAGAVAVIIYQIDGVDSLFNPANLKETGIPSVLIGNTSGVALKSFLAANPDHLGILDPSLQAVNATFDTVADFSSRGPAIGDSGKGEASIKPELVAVGTDVYTATQKLDPNGELYDVSGYTAAQGTSFAVPMVAGAVALVKQRNPSFRAAQLKSAVVNTAVDEVDDDQGSAPVTAVGAGKLDVSAAIQPGATVEPSTLSFGILTATRIPQTISLLVTNVGPGAAAFSVGVTAYDVDRNARVTATPGVLQLGAGQSATVAVQVTGTLPAPGSYSGVVTLKSGNLTLTVPYLYFVGDGIARNLIPLFGDGFVGIVRESGWVMGFKAVDRYGVPVANAPVRFRVSLGGGAINNADPATDVFGIAAADVTLGPTLGDQQFTADAGGLTLDFFGRARPQPAIDSGGAVNAASFQVGQGLAPGSYISIRGRGLSESTRIAATTSLPLSLAGVSVSFDAPAARLSLPGRIYFVSDTQINVQIPWELAGLNSVSMKVSIGEGQNDSSAVYAVPLSDYAPAAFEFDDAGSGRRLAAGLDRNFQLLTGANPARRGQAIQIYANGVGPVDNTPLTGEPSRADPLSRSRVLPTVKIGGVTADVLFSGLAPFNVGLYQLNVTIPADVPAGLQPVVITANGIDSKPVSIFVQ